MEKEWVKNALETNSDVKILMKGSIEDSIDGKLGVTSIIYISQNSDKVKKLYDELIKKDLTSFFMIYAVDFNVILNEMEHYPSIAISQEDFL